MKPLVSLIGRLVACSVKISVDTHKHTHTTKPSLRMRTEGFMSTRTYDLQDRGKYP